MQSDRREYFRIQETAWVLDARFRPELEIIAEYFPQLRHMVAQHELENIDAGLRQLDQKLEEDTVSRYLQLLNRKIDTFRRNLLIDQLDRLQQAPQSITISEGGVSWRAGTDWKPGDQLALAIVFSPSYVTVFVKAEVVDAYEADDGQGAVHATFVDMPETVRQELARHILAQQTRRRQHNP